MKYHLHSEKIQDKITITYIDGVLREVCFPAGMSDTQYAWFLQNVPKQEALLAGFAISGNFTSYALHTHTFEAFWDMYNHKVGKKDRAKKLWDSLGEFEQDRAMMGVIRYKRYLAQNPHIAQCYPETYLSQKRWENEYN